MNSIKTIGELIDETRIKSDYPTLARHDIMALERFAKNSHRKFLANSQGMYHFALLAKLILTLG